MTYRIVDHEGTEFDSVTYDSLDLANEAYDLYNSLYNLMQLQQGDEVNHPYNWWEDGHNVEPTPLELDTYRLLTSRRALYRHVMYYFRLTYLGPVDHFRLDY